MCKEVSKWKVKRVILSAAQGDEGEVQWNSTESARGNKAVPAILLEEGLAVEVPNRRGRKSGYGREHVLSAVPRGKGYHRGEEVVAVLDDCSRRVPAAESASAGGLTLP